MPEELWTEICNTLQETVTKAIPQREKCKKAKWLSEEALQTAEKRRELKGKGEREDIANWTESSRGQQREIKKAFLSEQCK